MTTFEAICVNIPAKAGLVFENRSKEVMSNNGRHLLELLCESNLSRYFVTSLKCNWLQLLVTMTRK